MWCRLFNTSKGTEAVCSCYKALERTRTTNTAVCSEGNCVKEQQSLRKSAYQCLFFYTAGGRWWRCLEKTFKLCEKKGKHAALHNMTENSSTVLVRNHDAWCLFPSGVDQSQPSKHLAFLCTVVGEHGICAHPSVFHLLSPPSPLAPGGRRGATREGAPHMFQQAVSCCRPAH